MLLAMQDVVKGTLKMTRTFLSTGFGFLYPAFTDEGLGFGDSFSYPCRTRKGAWLSFSLALGTVAFR